MKKLLTLLLVLGVTSTMAFAAEYNATAEKFSVNGNDGYRYISKEKFDEKIWTVYNYLFEDNKYILELSFWTNGSEKEIADVDTILSTLKKNEK